MISIVLNVFNEEETIEKDVQDIYNIIYKKFKNPEFIIFQDGSSDKTHKILLNLKKKYNFIYKFSDKRLGVDNALDKSLRICTKEYIFFLDGGNKFDIQDFWKLYKLKNKYDIISGLRSERQDQGYRKLFTFLLNVFLYFFTQSKFSDIDSGFKIFKKKNLNKILKLKKFNNYFYMSEICLKHIYLSMTNIEVPIKYFKRPNNSRALPILKIPKMITSYLYNFLPMLFYLKKKN
jgi:glycosyltransferase involved in cell wall biosynthesis